MRIAGDMNEKATRIKEAFGEVQIFVLENMDEFAILTKRMNETEFMKQAIALDSEYQKQGEEGLRQVIRAESEG